jgi:hypothetical protein
VDWNVALDFFHALVSDIQHRTQTCMKQDHVFKVCELALQAQFLAMKRKTLT